MKQLYARLLSSGIRRHVDCYRGVKVLETLGASVFRVHQGNFLDCHKNVSTPCIFVWSYRYKRFGRSCCVHLQDSKEISWIPQKWRQKIPPKRHYLCTSLHGFIPGDWNLYQELCQNRKYCAIERNAEIRSSKSRNRNRK